MTTFPWAPGSATGIGSMPGTDPGEATRTVFGELPDLPHLPELPDRGPGSDMLGRTAALLVDIAVDLQPSGWRLVDRPGQDMRRGRDHLAHDLDVLEEVADGYAGPLKLQVTGPWTLAAALELHYGDKVVIDPGAVRDLRQSLAEGAARHVAEVRRRVPGADVVLQVDEPGLPAVLAGRVPTASGFGTLPAVDEPLVEAGLAEVLAAAGATPVVHCCAGRPPLALFRAAGARALSYDADLVVDDEALGTAAEAGVSLWPGVVPSTDAKMSDLAGTVRPVQKLWQRLGFDPADLAARVVITPTCGLAGASPAHARAALRRARDAGRALAEEPDWTGGGPR
jgi:methionine synthase II (cobalamin-independent)